MQLICDFCSNLIKTYSLTLRCCGFTVCHEHYLDVDLCSICSNKFDLNECVSMLKNQLHLKIYNFQIQVDDFQTKLEEFHRLKSNPNTIFIKYSITDDRIKASFIREISSIQIDEIETKTNELIDDTLKKMAKKETKQDHIQILNRRIEILKDVNQNFNLEPKLIEYVEKFKTEKYKLVRLVKYNINKFVLDFGNRFNCISANLNGLVNLITSKNISTISDVKVSVLCIRQIKNSRIIFGLSNGKIHIWSLKNKKSLSTFDAHISEVICLQKLDSQLVVSGSRDGEMKLWNVKTLKYCFSYEGHEQSVNGIQNCVGAKKLASCSSDKTIKIWDWASKKCLNTLIGHDSIINCVKSLSPNMLASGSSDGRIKIWNIEKGECVKTLYDDGISVTCMEKFISQTLVVGTVNGKIKSWNYQTKKLNYSIDAHEFAVTCIKRPKEFYLISCSEDKTIKYWRLKI